MARKQKGGQVYVARDSGHAEIDGVPYTFTRGVTRVREGHPLTHIKGFENIFEPIDEHVHYDTEQATAAPDETRDVAVTVPSDEGYAAHTVAELHDMARDRDIAGASTMNKADLVAALEADDED